LFRISSYGNDLMIRFIPRNGRSCKMRVVFIYFPKSDTIKHNFSVSSLRLAHGRIRDHRSMRSLMKCKLPQLRCTRVTYRAAAVGLVSSVVAPWRLLSACALHARSRKRRTCRRVRVRRRTECNVQVSRGHYHAGARELLNRSNMTISSR
jgi:hypothetical protein